MFFLVLLMFCFFAMLIFLLSDTFEHMHCDVGGGKQSRKARIDSTVLWPNTWSTHDAVWWQYRLMSTSDDKAAVGNWSQLGKNWNKAFPPETPMREPRVLKIIQKSMPFDQFLSDFQNQNNLHHDCCYHFLFNTKMIVVHCSPCVSSWWLDSLVNGWPHMLSWYCSPPGYHKYQ